MKPAGAEWLWVIDDGTADRKGEGTCDGEPPSDNGDGPCDNGEGFCDEDEGEGVCDDGNVVNRLTGLTEYK